MSTHQMICRQLKIHLNLHVEAIDLLCEIYTVFMTTV